MCGNIKRLRFPDRPATQAEIDAAVLQYVRKVSNVRQPSHENEPAFEKARHDIARSVRKLLENVEPRQLKLPPGAKFKQA